MDGSHNSVEFLNALGPREASDAIFNCCGSKLFAERVEQARPFEDFQHVLDVANRVWWEEVPITGWLEAFAAHPRIGDVAGLRQKFASTAELCEGEQSAALMSADEQTLQELAAWNAKYEEKFGHVFLICAAGKSSSHVLEALKARYPNQPIYELQMAAKEQQQITELRLRRLSTLQPEARTSAPAGVTMSSAHGSLPPGTATLAPGSPPVAGRGSTTGLVPAPPSKPWHLMAGQSDVRRRLARLGAHLTSPLPSHPCSSLSANLDHHTMRTGAVPGPEPAAARPSPSALAADAVAGSAGTLRPPITTHVLDVALGKPAGGIGITLESLCGATPLTLGGFQKGVEWVPLGTSKTDGDGRSGALMDASDYLAPGTYRLTFEVEEYYNRVQGAPGFYPHVIIVFEVKASQSREHFHVPLLLAPYSYSTYRGS
eukprot:jgi/Mesen1/10977/ME000096S10550